MLATLLGGHASIDELLDEADAVADELVTRGRGRIAELTSAEVAAFFARYAELLELQGRAGNYAAALKVPGTEGGGQTTPFVPGSSPAYLDNVRTQGARELDLSVYKVFNFGETKVLRFDASAYNLSNTPQFGAPSVPSIVGAESQGLPFGLITNTVNTPRQFQFGSRFTF